MLFQKNHVILSQKLYESEDDVMKELLVALWEWVGLLKTYYKVKSSFYHSISNMLIFWNLNIFFGRNCE